MTELTELIELKGVKIEISKMDVFEQNDLIQDLLPRLTMALEAGLAASGNPAKVALVAVRSLLAGMSAKERNEIIFEKLLPNAHITGGLPLIGRSDKGGRTVMAQDLNLLDLYLIAGEVFRFNFEDFFTFADEEAKAFSEKKEGKEGGILSSIKRL